VIFSGRINGGFFQEIHLLIRACVIGGLCLEQGASPPNFLQPLREVARFQTSLEPPFPKALKDPAGRNRLAPARP
jgi:hypothetical protein